jgi:phage FluMu protein Com
MAIEFRCRSCEKLLRVGDEAAGRQVRCPACGELNHVPSLDAPQTSRSSISEWGPQAAASAPKQGVAGSPFAGAARAAPVSENPYQSPTALEPWDAVPTFGHAYEDYPPASRVMRLAGAMLDGLFYGLAVAPGFIQMSVVSDGVAPVGAILMLGGLALVAVINWVMIAHSGQSIAKRLLGMWIVKVDDGALPGFVRGVILRSWVPFLINQFCGLFGLLDALWIFGQERRCIHDYIAMTTVVTDKGVRDSIRCPECGRHVSETTVSCPGCGALVRGGGQAVDGAWRRN